MLANSSDRLTRLRLVFVSLGAALTIAALSACEGGGPGATCETEAGCRGGLGCLSAPGATRSVCMTPCRIDAGAFLCSDGEVCLELEGDRWCWLGGRTPLGSACADDFECEPGTICSGGSCRQFCGIPCAQTCYSNQSCVGNVCEDRPDANIVAEDGAAASDAGRDAGYADLDADCPQSRL